MNNSKMFIVKTFNFHEPNLHTILQRNLQYLIFLRTKIVFYLFFCISCMLNLCNKTPQNELRKIETRRIFGDFLFELYIILT